MGANVKKNNEWVQEKRERINLVMPKGTKERIAWVLMKGEKAHGFMVQAILNEIRRREELKGSGKTIEEQPQKQSKKPSKSSVLDDLPNTTKGVVNYDTGEGVPIEDDFVEEVTYDKTDPTISDIPWV